MRIIGVFLILVCCASPAVTQIAGSANLYPDIYGTTCEYYEDPSGFAFIYIIHQWTTGATSIEFRIELPSCMTYISESIEFYGSTGNLITGISIPYHVCLNHPIVLGCLIVEDAGRCPECTYVRVVENPNSSPPPDPGQVYVYDCNPVNPQLMIGTGGELIFDPTHACMCDVPVGETTWGQIKAMY